MINGHRAFITRRRALRPSEEYRTPTDEEWAEFVGHFERLVRCRSDLRCVGDVGGKAKCVLSHLRYELLEEI